MGSLTENIKGDLTQLKGKSADHVTHALKKMSGSEDGSMMDGVMKLIDAFIEDKQDSVSKAKKYYGVGGYITGTVITGLIAGGVCIYIKKKKEKKLETDRIQQIMNEEVKLAKEEKTVMK